MQMARPSFEGGFSNFFTLQRTPFVADMRRDQKDFHDWVSFWIETTSKIDCCV